MDAAYSVRIHYGNMLKIDPVGGFSLILSRSSRDCDVIISPDEHLAPFFFLSDVSSLWLKGGGASGRGLAHECQ